MVQENESLKAQIAERDKDLKNLRKMLGIMKNCLTHIKNYKLNMIRYY